MSRFVLRYQQSGVPIDEMKEIISLTPDVEIVDETPRMLLVEAEQARIDELAARNTGWLIVPETFRERPDPRPGINGPSGMN